MLLPLLCHVVPLKNGNCRLTMPVGRSAHDPLPETSKIRMFKFGEGNSNTMKMFTMILRTSLEVQLFICPQWAYKSHWYGDSPWHGWYGATCALSLHARLMSFRTKIHSHVMIYHHFLGKDVIEWFNHNMCERSVFINKYNHNRPCPLTKLQM